jgi:hypothetical protein
MIARHRTLGCQGSTEQARAVQFQAVKTELVVVIGTDGIGESKLH